MSDFPNAPAPHGALFDNAPTTHVYFREPPDTLTPAVRISQIRGGQWVAVPVIMQYGQPLALELALRRVSIGRTVFVQPGDKDAVMEAVSGQNGTLDNPMTLELPR